MHVWHASFNSMLQSIHEISGVPLDILKAEIRNVFQRHGTSEYAFVLQELPCLQKRYKSDLIEVFTVSVNAYRDARRSSLKLYPGVMEMLTLAREKGLLIIAYTESMAFYTSYRVRRLKLDGTLDYIYSPSDHDIPKGVDLAELRFYSSEEYKLRITKHLHTPKGVLKPSPLVLRDILNQHGLTPDQCVYVGDSLIKDIPMAQDVGVLDAFAEYGLAQDRREYDLLRQVSHWTDEEVEREKVIYSQMSARKLQPSIVLHHSMLELAEKLNL